MWRSPLNWTPPGGAGVRYEIAGDFKVKLENKWESESPGNYAYAFAIAFCGHPVGQHIICGTILEVDFTGLNTFTDDLNDGVIKRSMRGTYNR
jgi:hypothetical protein